MTGPDTPPLDADTIATLTQDVLAAINASAADLPGAVPLPPYQVLTTGGTVWDCEMVYVCVMSVQLGIQEPISGGSSYVLAETGQLTYPANSAVWTAKLECGVIRRVTSMPQGVQGRELYAPSTDSYLGDMVAMSSDTAVLHNAAWSMARDWGMPVAQDSTMFAASGGFHGVTLNPTVELWHKAM